MSTSAVVVGAGIAGLASAVSLARVGWQITVLERAAEAGEIGAGFAMSRNAVAAFRGLGFGDDDVAALGYATWAGGTFDWRGRPILTVPGSPEVRDAVGLIGVHRRRVHAALLGRAVALGVHVVPRSTVTDLDPGVADGAPAVVGGRAADLVVGADGIRSAVRGVVFPRIAPVYSGYSSWRAVVPGVFGGEALTQFWGPHAEYGILPTTPAGGPDETYWYGYVRMPERTRLGGPDGELAAAKARAAGWAAPVQEVLDATDPATLLRHDVHHLPGGAPSYTSGRVVLVGDAAHGTVPTMGQGAATALEDGLCVGLLVGAPVAAGGRLAPALAGFDAARRPRCRGLARASVASGRFGAHLGVGQGLRNALMRLTPTGAVVRGAEAAMGWTPPQAAPPVR
ncbi:FAD-dependent monooxygenase [Xylanimonas sp. McL0601]|uniref:FAD-dependent monooxygenase n=1 Tax=Xylanimonas sp. McL0601 TaxID=3414739 RepID=UPI003CF5583F